MSYNSRLALRNHMEKYSTTSLRVKRRDQCQNRKGCEYLIKIGFTRLRYNIHIFLFYDNYPNIYITVLEYICHLVLPSIKDNS